MSFTSRLIEDTTFKSVPFADYCKFWIDGDQFIFWEGGVDSPSHHIVRMGLGLDDPEPVAGYYREEDGDVDIASADLPEEVPDKLALIKEKFPEKTIIWAGETIQWQGEEVTASLGKEVGVDLVEDSHQKQAIETPPYNRTILYDLVKFVGLEDKDTISYDEFEESTDSHPEEATSLLEILTEVGALYRTEDTERDDFKINPERFRSVLRAVDEEGDGDVLEETFDAHREEPRRSESKLGDIRLTSEWTGEEYQVPSHKMSTDRLADWNSIPFSDEVIFGGMNKYIYSPEEGYLFWLIKEVEGMKTFPSHDLVMTYAGIRSPEYFGHVYVDESGIVLSVTAYTDDGRDPTEADRDELLDGFAPYTPKRIMFNGEVNILDEEGTSFLGESKLAYGLPSDDMISVDEPSGERRDRIIIARDHVYFWSALDSYHGPVISFLKDKGVLSEDNFMGTGYYQPDPAGGRIETFDAEDRDGVIKVAKDLGFVSVVGFGRGDNVYLDEQQVAKQSSIENYLSPEIISHVRHWMKELNCEVGSSGECTEVAFYIEEETGYPREDGFFFVDGDRPRDHAWNRLPDGSILDATASQFGIDDDLVIIPSEDDRQSNYVRPKTVEEFQYYESLMMGEKQASILSPIHDQIADDIWDIDAMVIEPELERFIFEKIGDALDSYDTSYEDHLKRLYIIGSITGRQYSEDSDVDVNIYLDIDEWAFEMGEDPEELRNSVRKALVNQNGDLPPDSTHPVNFFLSSTMEDPPADGIYDVLNDIWVKHPENDYPEEFDPYKEFSAAFERAEELAERVDTFWGKAMRSSEAHMTYGTEEHRNRYIHYLKDLVETYETLAQERRDVFDIGHRNNIDVKALQKSDANVIYKAMELWGLRDKMLSAKAALKQIEEEDHTPELALQTFAFMNRGNPPESVTEALVGAYSALTEDSDVEGDLYIVDAPFTQFHGQQVKFLGESRPGRASVEVYDEKDDESFRRTVSTNSLVPVGTEVPDDEDMDDQTYLQRYTSNMPTDSGLGVLTPEGEVYFQEPRGIGAGGHNGLLDMISGTHKNVSGYIDEGYVVFMCQEGELRILGNISSEDPKVSGLLEEYSSAGISLSSVELNDEQIKVASLNKEGGIIATISDGTEIYDHPFETSNYAIGILWDDGFEAYWNYMDGTAMHGHAINAIQGGTGDFESTIDADRYRHENLTDNVLYGYYYPYLYSVEMLSERSDAEEWARFAFDQFPEAQDFKLNRRKLPLRLRPHEYAQFARNGEEYDPSIPLFDQMDRVGKKAESRSSSDGVMIALVPPEEVRMAFEVENGEEYENHHITLAYLPDFDSSRGEELKELVENWCDTALEGKPSGYGTFHNDENHVLYVGWDIPGIDDFRSSLCQMLEEHYDTDCDKDHGFTPHETLDYSDEEIRELPDWPDGVDEIVPLELVVAIGEEWHGITSSA